MNQYEMVVILKDQLEDETRQKAIDRLVEAIESNGEVTNIDEWGSRKLAYEIDYNKKGYYTIIQYKADPSVVAEVERRARILDAVIRYMTVRKED